MCLRVVKVALASMDGSTLCETLDTLPFSPPHFLILQHSPPIYFLVAILLGLLPRFAISDSIIVPIVCRVISLVPVVCMSSEWRRKK